MICPNCGSEIPNGSVFCTNCGTRIDAAAQQQPYQQQAPQDAYQLPHSQQSQQWYQPPQPPQYPGQQAYQQQPQYQQQYQQPQYQQQYQQQQYQQPYAQQPVYNAYGAPQPRSVGFGEAIKLYFTNYVNFTGRSTRGEFWWAALFTFLLSIVVTLIARRIPAISYIFSLGLFLPSLSLSIRRLHDIGKAWPWILISLIPIVGVILMIVYCCRPSDNNNQWGPVPR